MKTSAAHHPGGISGERGWITGLVIQKVVLGERSMADVKVQSEFPIPLA